jgi:hypothetical protein
MAVVQYVRSVRQHLDQLMHGAGIDQLTKSLGGFVGQSVAARSYQRGGGACC